MPDTGAPWNIPYVAGTDLVSDWPTDSQALANAIADGLDDAGGLVTVKHALFTGTQSNSTAAGADFAVTDLSITHTLAAATNKLIISAYFGVAATSGNDAAVGIAVADGATLIGVGATAGNRVSVGAGARTAPTTDPIVSTMPSVTFVYAPGDTASHTYTVRAINIDQTTRTIYVNRSTTDTDNEDFSRGASGFVIQEVKP